LARWRTKLRGFEFADILAWLGDHRDNGRGKPQLDALIQWLGRNAKG
jgi:hypothetical protein